MIGVIVEKNGDLTEVTLKEDTIEHFSKKCSLKNTNNFEYRCKWGVNISKKEYIVSLYAKDKGRANTECKYDFPPPVDNELYFGNCLLVNHTKEEELSSLSKEDWIKIYEHLFGGFESLLDTIEEDENEEDELDNIPAEMKTKDGYLKDGFVVDKEEIEDDVEDYEEEEEDDDDEDDEDDDEDEFDLESELTEEPYCYSDED
jgi:hypothetical protein